MTADGKPVTDLTQADFEVKEDGVVQTIRSFEAVRHTAQPVGIARRNPSTVAESEAMIADPRRRVFVVFLDTFHVERMEAMWVRKQLLAFFKDSLGPDTTAVHATHLTETDRSLLGESGATACFCPTTEADLADGIGPARELLDAGCRLSLGSDQHAVIDPLVITARSTFRGTC